MCDDSSWGDSCPVTPLPFENHLRTDSSTSYRPEKQASEKADQEPYTHGLLVD